MNHNFNFYLRIIFLLFFIPFMVGCTFIDGLKSNVENESVVFIRTNATYQEVLDSLKLKLKNIRTFDNYAKSIGFPENIHPGKYKLEEGSSNRKLLDKFIDGEQEEIQVRIKNEPTIFHLAGSVSKLIEADSTQIVNAIIHWANEQNSGLNAETVKQYFIPNTYNYYWPTTGEQFVKKMILEYNKVWTEKRKEEAKSINLTPLQVVTLASIVQLEASMVDEQPKVAKAYLNRLERDLRLEADPTSIYAYKLQNGFNNKIQRVKHGHLAIPSDYNTYRVKGLPPAPICLPNLSAIDAVLHPDSHDFIYFCADPDRPGYHSFTNDYKEHLLNADKYRKWLAKRGIE